MTGAKRISTRHPPWQGPDSEGISFGAWLRQQREVRQIGLREVAESSKISLRYLQAFEQDHFDILPAPVFAKGFLRQYSAYVGLDADEVVNHYLWALQEAEPELEEEEVAPRNRERNLLPFLALGVVLLVILVGALWLASGSGDKAEEVPAEKEFVAPPTRAVPPVAVPTATSPTPTGPVAPLRVALEFTRSCWVIALVDGGASRIARTYLPGEPLQIDAQESVLFRELGNSGGVKIEVNGLPFELAGSEGRVIRELRIDLETAARLAAAP